MYCKLCGCYCVSRKQLEDACSTCELKHPDLMEDNNIFCYNCRLYMEPFVVSYIHDYASEHGIPFTDAISVILEYWASKHLKRGDDHESL